MKKIFITGGTGTVGSAFIQKYYNNYKIMSYSRNEKNQVGLKRKFPKIEITIGGIENAELLISEILKFKPDVILHCAALKHVDTAEKQPSQASEININGSLNIIKAAIIADVKTTVGISTDKACEADNIYGWTKFIMEKLFQEYNSDRNKFSCCRFGNVAWSNGSVIPFWISRFMENKPLPLTSENMTRLMFSAEEAATLVEECIQRTSKGEGGIILSKKMKMAKMLKLARLISDNIEIIGLRPGEKLYESLISDKELSFTKVDNDYIEILSYENLDLKTRLKESINSDNTIEMTEAEMKLLIGEVNLYRNTTLGEKNIY